MTTTISRHVLLLVHMQVAGHVADAAAKRNLFGGDPRRDGGQLLADAPAAVLVLLVAVTLSVYKPRGITFWMAQTA
ncbi:hypothetical protein ACFV1X_26570 [Streptomyces coelicoflavus]|uniref:hypothetical protein n=1 Tax=Streptomyces coelicoflavus TaxID=285562 RepID=UPI00368D4367